MESPAVVLVPPSPSPYPIASPSTSTATRPRPSFRDSRNTRDSSETAIFSIYSMYGDEQANRTSWAAAPARNESKKAAIVVNRTSIGNGDSELAYFQPEVPPKPPPTHSLQSSISSSRTTPSSFNVRQARQSRPVSSYATSSSRLSAADMDDRRASTGHTFKDSTFSSSQSVPAFLSSHQSEESSVTPSRRSRTPPVSSSRSSSLRRKSVIDRELPPLPPPTVHISGQITPPKAISSAQSPDLLNVPKGSPAPTIPPGMPLKHPPYVSGSMSNTSLIPSDGEDMDGFHVRNTYAQLEQSGVKGDGYDDGIERTRARVGASRASQMLADEAIGDGSEKSRELDAKEVETLANVDRYGFFSTPSHDRLVLLPAAQLLKPLSVTSPGPPASATAPKSLDAVPPSRPPIKEPGRIEKWTRMLKPRVRDPGGNVGSWTVKPSKESKLRERTYKGVPDRWRPASWELSMSRASGLSMDQVARLGAEYRDALEKPSTYDIQIDLDVPRTISGHIMFRTRYGAGQRSLFHVLHSFSLRCPTCGYVQGMGPIAATLLCYFEPERVYASLVRLHDAYSLHDIFSPGFPGLLEAIYVQERITEMMMPGVYHAFKKHMISTTSYATKWYITLFANSVPFQTQLRFWDVFLLEGQDVFVAIAVAIVWVYRDHITASAANFETVLSLLSSFFVPEDEDSLMAWIGKALGDKKLRANIRQWRADWQGLVAAGKDGDALL